MTNKAPRVGPAALEQEWFKKRRIRNRRRSQLQKASRKRNR